MLGRFCLMLLLGLIATFLQGTVLGMLLPKYLVPNFVLILVVFLAFFESSVMGLFLSFVLGLEFDLLSGLLLGPWAGAFVIVFGALTLTSRRMFIESPMAALLAVFFSCCIGTFVYLLLLNRFSPAQSDILSFWLIGHCVITALVAPTVMRWLKKLYVKRGSSRGGRFS